MIQFLSTYIKIYLCITDIITIYTIRNIRIIHLTCI